MNIEWKVGKRFGLVAADRASDIQAGDIIGVWTHRSDSDLNAHVRVPQFDFYRTLFYNWGKRTPCLMRVLFRKFSDDRSFSRLVCVPFGRNGRWADGTVCKVVDEGAIACVGYPDSTILEAAEADMPRFREAFARLAVRGKGPLGDPHGGNTDMVRAIMSVGGLPPDVENFTLYGGPDNFDAREEVDSLIAAVRDGMEMEAQWSGAYTI